MAIQDDEKYGVLTRLITLITSSIGKLTDNVEVILARGVYGFLHDRLDNYDLQLGDISQLNTDDKSSFVNAVKEVKLGIAGNQTNIVNLQTQIQGIGNASPKGTYATVAALTTAFPGGNTNNYVVTADGGWYYWNGSVWFKGGTYQSSGVATKGVRPINLDRMYSDGVPGKQKFDPMSVTNGHYVNGLTGADLINASYYLSDYIPLPTVGTNVYCTGFAFEAIYDINGNYIRGWNANQDFTVQANEAYLRVSNSISYIGYALVEFVTKTGVVEPFKLQAVNHADKSVDLKHITDTLKQYIDSKQSSVAFPILIVDKSGKGDYTTISDAVANSGSNLANKLPVTIFVMPGIYDELVDIRGKYISLIGVDKSQCILKNTSGDYYKPPLWATSNFYCANMTFVANSVNVADPAPALKNYGVHIEYDPTYPHIGGVGEFFNCDIISEHNASAVGLGLHTNIEIIFDRCNIKSTMPACTVPALFAHNYIYAGSTGQKLTVKNCWLETNHLAVYRFDDSNHQGGGGMDNTDTEFTFVNTMGWSSLSGKTNVITGDTTPHGSGKFGYIKLGAKSYGNNVAELNL